MKTPCASTACRWEVALIGCGQMNRADGNAGLRQLLALPQPPDAVFSGNCFSAAGALEVLHERGRRGPENVGLAASATSCFCASRCCPSLPSTSTAS
jgi:DNA-binding LacI/PurR family transcriptional regulator